MTVLTPIEKKPNQLNYHNEANTMKVGIMIYIPPELLTEIESRIKGKSRSEKIVTCAKEGFARLAERMIVENPSQLDNLLRTR